MNFGQELRRIRESRKLSQRAAAAILGVSYGSVQKWERGAREPEPLSLPELTKRLEKLSKARPPKADADNWEARYGWRRRFPAAA